MPNEELQEALEMINIVRKTIKYLKENKNILVENGLKEILSNEKIYLKKLQSNNNLENFKKSIINGHFNWILDDMYNPSEVDFNEYNKNSLFTFSKAYCDFYKSLNQNIDIIKDEEIKEVLQDYFYAFSEMYCS